MSSTIYLVRHTQYELSHGNLPGRLPVPLSAEGVAEAEKLRKFFAEKQIAKIYSSAVERCKHTAQIISNNSIPVEMDRRLLEGMSAYQGFWLKEQWHFYNHLEDLGGETFEDIQHRMVSFFENTQWETEIRSIRSMRHWESSTHVHNILPDDYLQKGSVREIFVEDAASKKMKIGKLITQEYLSVVPEIPISSVR